MTPVRELLACWPGVLHREMTGVAQLGDILRDLAQEGVTVLAVNGGDGTIQAVVSALLNDGPFDPLPVLAILPSGKTNMTAHDLGGCAAPGELLKKLHGLIDDGRLVEHLVERRLIGLRRAPGEAPIYGAFFGAAAIVRGIEYARAHVFPLGLPNFLSHSLTIILILVSLLWPWRREAIGLSDGDEAGAPRHYFIIMATSLRRLLLGIKPFEGLGLPEDQLHYAAVDYSPGAIWRGLWAILRGRPPVRRIKGVVRDAAEKLRLDLDGPVTLDGEMFYPEPGEPMWLSLGKPVTFVHFPEG